MSGEVISVALRWGTVAMFAYAILVQVVLAACVVATWWRWRRPHPSDDDAELGDIYDEAAPAKVSVLMPVHDEGPVVVDTVSSVLGNRWPNLEVIVVNDGSTDDTFERLQEQWNLVPLRDRPEPSGEVDIGIVKGYWRSLDEPRLLVLDRAGGGTKAGAVNAALDAATGEWLINMDGDQIIDPDTVGRCMVELRARLDAPVAVGTTVLPVNASTVHDDGSVSGRVPGRWLTGCQTVEYLRSFSIGRSGFAAMGALPLVSGAFGLYRTDHVRHLNGWSDGHLGEDLDFTVRTHRSLIDRDEPYSMVQVLSAVTWTEVPSTVGALGRQRVRWHQGLTATVGEHRRMIANPRYGPPGTVGMAAFALTEWLAPLVEASGLVLAAIAVFTGALNWSAAVALWVTAALAAIVATVAAMAVEARRVGVFASPCDGWRLALWAVVEQFGFRQLTVWWRLRSLVGGDRSWG